MIDQGLNGLNPLSYLGVNALSPMNLNVRNVDPSSTDSKNFAIGDMWVNRTNNRMYQLINLEGGVATWEGITYFVTRNINPTTNDNHYALGTMWLNTGTLDVFQLLVVSSTSPFSATWVLMMDASGPLLQITTDDATIVLPAAGNINLHGANNIITSGSGSTATVSLTGTTNHALQVGNASAGITSLSVATNGQIPIGSTGGSPVIASIIAGSGISVTNGSGSITIAALESDVVKTLTGNTGGAISPSAGNINTVGSANISITGSGSTLTTTLIGTTNHSIQLGNSSGSLTSLGVATNGQLPIGSSGADPVLATLIAGTNISITNGSGSITIGDTQAQFLSNYTLVNTSPYVVLSTDYYLGVDCSGGAITIQLPNAPTTNRTFIIKDITGSSATHAITVTTVGGIVTLDGGTSFIMNTNYESINTAFVTSSYQIY